MTPCRNDTHRVTLIVLQGFRGSSKEPGANIIRFAKTIEKEQPLLMPGVREMALKDPAHAEEALHKLIRQWGLALPLDIHYFSRGELWCPMLKPSTWFEYLICEKPEILLGGFPRNHPAVGDFLESFWRAYKFEDPEHVVFSQHAGDLCRCIPYCIFADEGRGLRKAPIQIVGLETVFNIRSFRAFQKKMKASDGRYNQRLLWSIQRHTGAGSSLTSRLLLYVLPHSAYKAKLKQNWYKVLDEVVQDFAGICTAGFQCDDGTRWFPIFIGLKGDAPALSKIGQFTRSFNHLLGPAGVCHHCLGGRPEHPWEDLSSQATWRNTCYVERPWKANKPACILPIPFSVEAPEKAYRSDCMHLIKLGIARHFVASVIVAFGDLDVFNGSASSVAALLENSHSDFVYCCKREIKQTPNLKQFTKDSLHWPRRSSYPWGGHLLFFVKMFILLP